MEQYIDMHCHILPGVDDGASSVEEMEKMLLLAYKEGIRCIIATPHHHPKRGHEKPELLKKRLKLVRIAAKKIDENFRVYLGTEIFFGQDIPEKILKGEVLKMNNREVVLLEFSPSDEFDYIYQGIQQVQAAGTEVILAHCERYQCLIDDFELVEQLHKMGTLFQINANSITNKRTRKFIRKLMDADYVFGVGTDAHDSRVRPPKIQEAAQYVTKKYGKDYTRRIFFSNAASLLRKTQ